MFKHESMPLKANLLFSGIGYNCITKLTMQTIAQLINFEDIFGYSYDDYLIRLCAKTVHMKVKSGSLCMEHFVTISGDAKPCRSECKSAISIIKRKWKILSGNFQAFLNAVVSFLLIPIGEAKIQQLTIIARPQGARRGFWHTDVKLYDKDGKYNRKYFDDPQCGGSFWFPLLDDELAVVPNGQHVFQHVHESKFCKNVDQPLYKPALIEAQGGSIVIFRGDLPHRHCNYNHSCAVIHGDIAYNRVASNNGGFNTISSNVCGKYFYNYDLDDEANCYNHIVPSPSNHDEMISYVASDLSHIHI
jgi:hypothetical protein